MGERSETKITSRVNFKKMKTNVGAENVGEKNEKGRPDVCPKLLVVQNFSPLFANTHSFEALVNR
jgi:hypothetical protein